jgi:hypothetical protein
MRTTNRVRAIIITCGAVAVLLAALLFLDRLRRTKHEEEIKPYLTYTRLLGAARDCDAYWMQHRSWPESLAQLRVFRPALHEWAIDMWDRDFVVITYDASKGYGQIISYGRDGKPGGNAEADRDIEVRFPSETNAVWNKQAGEGLKKPDVRLQ